MTLLNRDSRGAGAVPYNGDGCQRRNVERAARAKRVGMPRRGGGEKEVQEGSSDGMGEAVPGWVVWGLRKRRRGWREGMMTGGREGWGRREVREGDGEEKGEEGQWRGEEGEGGMWERRAGKQEAGVRVEGTGRVGASDVEAEGGAHGRMTSGSASSGEGRAASSEGTGMSGDGEGRVAWASESGSSGGVAEREAVSGTGGGDEWPRSTVGGDAPHLCQAAAGRRVTAEQVVSGCEPACSFHASLPSAACAGHGGTTLCVKGPAGRSAVETGTRAAEGEGVTISERADWGANETERGDKTVSLNVLIGRGTPEKTRKEEIGVGVMLPGKKDGWAADGERGDKVVSVNVLIGRGTLGRARKDRGRERGSISGKEWEGSEGKGGKVVSMNVLVGRGIEEKGRMEASTWKEGTRAEGGDQLDGVGCNGDTGGGDTGGGGTGDEGTGGEGTGGEGTGGEGTGGEGTGDEGRWEGSEATRHGWQDGVGGGSLARTGADTCGGGAFRSALDMLGAGQGGEDERGRDGDGFRGSEVERDGGWGGKSEWKEGEEGVGGDRGREQGRGVGSEGDGECEAGRDMGDEVVVVRTRGEGEMEREGCRGRVEESEVAVRECGGLRWKREGETARETAGGARAAEGGAEGAEAVRQWGDAAEQRQARVGTRAAGNESPAPLTAGGSTAAHALVGASTPAGMAPLPPQGPSMTGGAPPGIPLHAHSTATHPTLPPRPPPPAAASPLSLLRLPPLPQAQPQAATCLQAARVTCTGSQPSHPAVPPPHSHAAPLLCPLPPHAPTPPLLTLPTPRPDCTPSIPTRTPPPPQPTLHEIATYPSSPPQAMKSSKHVGLEGTASFGQRLVVLALPAPVHVGVDVKGARRGRVEGGRAVGAVVEEGERAGRGERRARGEKAVGGTVGRRGREVRERGGWEEVRVQVQERVGQAEVEVRREKRRAEKGVERGRWGGEGWAMKRGRVARSKPAKAGVASRGDGGHSMRPAAAPRSEGAAAPRPGLLCAGARQTGSVDGSEEESKEGCEEEGEEGSEGSEDEGEGSEEGSEGSEEGSGEDREEGSGESSVSGEGPRIRKVWRRSEQGGEAEQGGRAEGERQRRVEAVVRRVRGEQAGRKHGRSGRVMLSDAGGRREQRWAHGARAGECGAAWLEQGSSSSDALGDSSSGAASASASENRSASEEMQSPPHSKCRNDSLAAARAGLAWQSVTRSERGGGGGVEGVVEEKHGRGADGGEDEQSDQGVMAEVSLSASLHHVAQ
ncbi:unnamed protein product [Closterium sp. NIES-53]